MVVSSDTSGVSSLPQFRETPSLMKPRQIGNFNTGTSGLLLALVLVTSPVQVIKACFSKLKDD